MTKCHPVSIPTDAAVRSFDMEALTKVIEDFDAGAGRQDRGRIRMARAQAGGAMPLHCSQPQEDQTFGRNQRVQCSINYN